MSRPMLPGQNSKYWGFDLNNYLLDLDRRVGLLEGDTNSGQVSIRPAGPGFINGTWNIEGGSTTNINLNAVNDSIKINGKCVFETFRDNVTTYYIDEVTDYKPFNNDVFYTTFVTNSYGNLVVDNPQQFVTSSHGYQFLAVYLYFTISENAITKQTVVSEKYIFRGDMIMIGSLEKNNENSGNTTYSFIPRVYDCYKTLYQTSKDTMSSTARIDGFSYVQGSEDLPSFEKTVDGVTTYDSFYFCTNGVDPSATIGFSGDSSWRASFDIKKSTFMGTTTYFIKESDGTVTKQTTLSGINYNKNSHILTYYLAPSGNRYVQVHARPINSTKDFRIEANDPLTSYEGYETSGLVMIGALLWEDTQNNLVGYYWYNAKQNGIDPLVIDNDNENFHKVLLANQQFWVGSTANNTYYHTLIDPVNDVMELKKENAFVDTLYLKNKISVKDGIKNSLLTSTSLEIKENNEKVFLIDKNNLLFTNSLNFYDGNFLISGITDTITNEAADSLASAGSADRSFPVLKDYDYFVANYGGTTITLEVADTVTEKTKGTFTLKYDPSTKTVSSYSTSTGTTLISLYGHINKKISSSFNTISNITTSNSLTVEGNTSLTTVTTSDTLNARNGLLKVGFSNTIYSSAGVDNVAVNGALTVSGVSTFAGNVVAKGTLSAADVITATKGLSIGNNTHYFDEDGHIKCEDILFVSDRRAKENIKSINENLCYDAVKNLDVKTYNYIESGYSTLGLIAQEIEEQLPEYAHLIVHENEKGEKIVSEHKLLFILWQALRKEIKERNGGK